MPVGDEPLADLLRVGHRHLAAQEFGREPRHPRNPISRRASAAATIAAVAIFLVARRSSGGPELLGLVTGAGFLGIVVWVLSRGEWDATRWLVAGIALCAAGVAAYAAARARHA